MFEYDNVSARFRTNPEMIMVSEASTSSSVRPPKHFRVSVKLVLTTTTLTSLFELLSD